jgi:hypothetical protein
MDESVDVGHQMAQRRAITAHGSVIARRIGVFG